MQEKKRSAKTNGPSQAETTHAAGAQPTDLTDEIRQRAHQLYVERAGAPGDPVGDWVRAEKEVTERRGNGAAKR